MGIRGELFTTQIPVENRTYFFNVKENRLGDVFLQIVESKNTDGAGFDRVMRGGSWYNSAGFCVVGKRIGVNPDGVLPGISGGSRGFRVACRP